MMKYIVLYIYTTVLASSFLFSQTGALNFDGVDDFIEIENTTFNSIDTGNFTFEAWINGNDQKLNLEPVIFSNLDSSENGIEVFLIQKNSNSNFKEIGINIGGQDYFEISNINVTRYFCQHVAITKTANELSFYLNGNKIGTDTLILPSTSVSSPKKIWIGKGLSSNSHYSGLISGVRIWNKALTDSEIKDFQTENISGNTPHLIGCWDFKNKPKQNLTDLTGNSIGNLGNNLVEDPADPVWIHYGSAPRIDLGNDTILSLAPLFSIIQNPDNAWFEWSDGFSALVFNIERVYQPGIYWAKATNQCGTSYDTIVIKFQTIIYLPNTFTPDGDSFNENFRAFYSGNSTNFKFLILTRDRQLVFESNDPEEAWDGRFNGALVQSGVYVWMIQFTNVYGELEEHIGTVNVLR